MDLFLTHSLERLIASLRSLGYLEAATAGIAATAFAVGYLLIRRTVANSERVDYARIGRLAMRVALGGIFFVIGGLNGLLQLAAGHPATLHGTCVECERFMQGILATGYLFPLLKTVELVAGAMLLLALWVPLALVMLAPIVINIFLYHLRLDPSGLPLAALVLALELGLAWRYRSVFAPLFVAHPLLPAGGLRAAVSPFRALPRDGGTGRPA